MQVTDAHVQLLRDFLADDPGAVERAQEQEQRQPRSLDEFPRLVEAAFVISARRVFAPTWSLPEVIEFVARARVEEVGGDTPFGALDAERVLRRAFGDQVPPPQSDEAVGAAMMCMLHVLVADLKLDDAGLSELLEQARAAAGESLGQKAPQQPGTGLDDAPGQSGTGTGAEIRQQSRVSAESGPGHDTAESRWSAFARQMLGAFEKSDAERRADADKLKAANLELKQEIQGLRAEVQGMAVKVDALETRLGLAPGPGPGR